MNYGVYQVLQGNDGIVVMERNPILEGYESSILSKLGKIAGLVYGGLVFYVLFECLFSGVLYP